MVRAEASRTGAHGEENGATNRASNTLRGRNSEEVAGNAALVEESPASQTKEEGVEQDDEMMFRSSAPPIIPGMPVVLHHGKGPPQKFVIARVAPALTPRKRPAARCSVPLAEQHT